MRRFVTLAVTAFACHLVSAEHGDMSAGSGPARAEPGKSSGAFYDSGGKTDAEKPPASGGAYELRGFFGSGENLEVSVRRAGTGRSEWVRIGQSSGGLLVEKADPNAGTATLVVDGRRIRLRLAGEQPPEPPKVVPPHVEEKKPSPEEARALREARFQAMHENMTPEQIKAFRKVMQIKMPELRTAQPELFKGSPPENAEARQKMRALMIPLLREASEASAKLPGKDGKITPVPADFDELMTGVMDDSDRPRPVNPAN